ncbi:hypothetical protein [Burkholderia ubonensis]|uniref:hypothetical protein n=1 Tax=Burkholderia ubonensis TaxID=101571 RepID=UPI000AEC24A8|nr:hypothetical protein [Burkholderia ubonensis]
MKKNIGGVLRLPTAIVAAVLACAACGGGDDPGHLTIPNATAGGQTGPMLRACEAPEAPCPASQPQAAAGK